MDRIMDTLENMHILIDCIFRAKRSLFTADLIISHGKLDHLSRKNRSLVTAK